MITKWVCVNNSSNRGQEISLTLDKVYEGEYTQLRDLVFVTDDTGKLYGFITSRFRLLSDIREEQIKSILDE
jgi:Mg/Co/Ni transporter MgtE